MDQKNGFQSFHDLGHKIDLKCMGVLWIDFWGNWTLIGRFLTILTFGTPPGAETSLGPKKCIFSSKIFKRVCLCVHILFGGVRAPKRAGRVHSVSQNKFEHPTTLQSWDFVFWSPKNFGIFPPSVAKTESSFKGYLRFCYGGGEMTCNSLT